MKKGRGTMKKPVKVMVCFNSYDEALLCVNALDARKITSKVVPPDGAAAEAELKSGAYSYAIIDSCLPGADAAAIIESIKKEPSRPEIIVCDPEYNESNHRYVLGAGAAYYAVKPLNMEMIAERICQSKVKNEQMADENLEIKISELFIRFGIPASISGYTYLRRAVIMSAESPDMLKRRITKELYPEIAKEYHTTPARVERAMRHAITVAWNRGELELLERLFGYTIDQNKGKPANSEFIAMIADAVRLGRIDDIRLKK